MTHPSCRIVIADDHELLRKGVGQLLGGIPRWQIVGEAGDGLEALQLARETRPDIAILDYSLPTMNGLSLTSAIKNELPRTEILIYSMYENESMLVDVLRAGARGYVLKSDSSVHLLAALEALSHSHPYFSPALSQTLLDRYLLDIRGSKASVLTPREREVVQLVAEGRSNKQIAELLKVGVKTIDTHRGAVMNKLNFHTTAQLVLFAVRNDIVQT